MRTKTEEPILAQTDALRDEHKCVAIFAEHTAAERAVKELHRAGFDMRKLSIVGTDFHTDEHVVGFCNTGQRVRYWGKLGAFWGGIFGILLSPAAFWIPGVGPILTGGALGSVLMGMLEGGTLGAVASGGLTALGAGLFSLGIPENSVLRYERALKAGRFLLIAHGSEQDVRHARELLGRHTDDLRTHEPE